ncbi:ComEC/Rec2 family competence protein [Spiroplasma endosymbiont of Othius punctulatus]|uniref:ComEC/Rec2 family competence protein n=1 Tax=Spiroplasma endosymbiont of Othius punctulatus TaxID=3066289 RepID=UPI0030CC2E47
MYKTIMKILFCLYLPFYLLIVITNGNILKMQHKNNVAFITLSVGNGLFSFLKIDNSAIIFDCGIGGNPMNWDDGVQGNSSFPTNYMKSIGIEKIDNIFISHNHVDHYSNLKTIQKNFEISNISVPYNYNKMNKQIKGYIKDSKANIISFRRDYSFSGINFSNLTYDWVVQNGSKNKNENNNSMVLDFKFKNKTFLLTGDIESEPTKDMVTKHKEYDYFQVPHHGSDNSGTTNILKKVKPNKCIISGTRNTKLWRKFSGGHEFPTDDIFENVHNRCQSTYITGSTLKSEVGNSYEYVPASGNVFKNAKTIQNK